MVDSMLAALVAAGLDPEIYAAELAAAPARLAGPTCPTCDGDGGWDSRHDAGPDAWVPCPTCGGRGR